MHVNALVEAGAQASFGELHGLQRISRPSFLCINPKRSRWQSLAKALLLCLGLAVEPILVIGHVSQGFLLPADWSCALRLSAAHALAESFGALAILFSLRHLECLVRKETPAGVASGRAPGVRAGEWETTTL